MSMLGTRNTFTSDLASTPSSPPRIPIPSFATDSTEYSPMSTPGRNSSVASSSTSVSDYSDSENGLNSPHHRHSEFHYNAPLLLASSSASSSSVLKLGSLETLGLEERNGVVHQIAENEISSAREAGGLKEDDQPLYPLSLNRFSSNNTIAPAKWRSLGPTRTGSNLNSMLESITSDSKLEETVSIADENLGLGLVSTTDAYERSDVHTRQVHSPSPDPSPTGPYMSPRKGSRSQADGPRIAPFFDPLPTPPNSAPAHITSFPSSQFLNPPPAKSPARYLAIQIPPGPVRSSSSVSSSSSTSLVARTSRISSSLISPISTPTSPNNASFSRMPGLDSSAVPGPGYELISLDEARRREKQKTQRSVSVGGEFAASDSSLVKKELAAPQSSNASVLKPRKSGFFRRIVSGNDAGSSSPSRSRTNSTSANKQSLPSPSMTFPGTLKAPTSGLLPSPVIPTTSPPSVLTSEKSVLDGKIPHSVKNRSIFSLYSTPASNKTPVSRKILLAPSLNLRPISSSFSSGLPTNFLRNDFKVQAPTDTTSKPPPTQPAPTSDHFGRWSIFDSDDFELLKAPISTPVLISASKSRNGGSVSKSQKPATAVVTPIDDFAAFISTKSFAPPPPIPALGTASIKPHEFSRSKSSSSFGQTETSLFENDANPTFADSESIQSPMVGLEAHSSASMMSRPRFLGHGGKGALYGSKVVSETRTYADM